MLEEKHKGHEVMHLEMILIFFGSIIVTQLILVLWRTKHKKSYQVSSLVQAQEFGVVLCTLAGTRVGVSNGC